jgi:hypothetical protein
VYEFASADLPDPKKPKPTGTKLSPSFDSPLVRLLTEPSRLAFPTDGAAAEPELENFLDLRQAIEPCDELLAGFAVFEAAVQLVAEMFGEPSDFAIASDHRNRLRIDAAEGLIFDFRFAICDLRSGNATGGYFCVWRGIRRGGAVDV